MPGRVLACACDGGTGWRTCDEDGAFGPCECLPADAPPVPPSDAPPTDAPLPCNPYAGESCGCPEASPPDESVLPAPTRVVTLEGGEEGLVDVLPIEAGLVVALLGEVRLYGRDGTRAHTWVTARTITNVATDGHRLVVANGGMLTVLDGSLREVHELPVTERCTQGVLVSCDRYVCGTNRDRDRIFYTYDITTGVEVARSTPAPYTGVGMVRVPGVDAFLTMTVGYSPADWYYHRVEPSGEVVLIGDSPYHGDFPLTDVLAFIGRPAIHAISFAGDVFRLDRCVLGAPGTTPPECLVTIGNVSPRPAGTFYSALSPAGPGLLAGVWCAENTSGQLVGCSIDRVDLTTRDVVSRRPTPVDPVPLPLRFRHDPWSGAALLASALRCGSEWWLGCDGWQARLVPYE